MVKRTEAGMASWNHKKQGMAEQEVGEDGILPGTDQSSDDEVVDRMQVR
jgi:hypothetical protein